MSSDPTVTPPPVDASEPLPGEHPYVHFSRAHWFSTGFVRVLYRGWTRIAAHLFPEESKAEHIALALHIPLPDQLNMSWITDHLAVGGRIRPQDIKAVARVGVTDVVDTRAEHRDDIQALAKEHIDFLYLPTPDTRPLTVGQMMEGSKWVQERMQQGRRVLVHCEHGVGRSALLACAVLVYGGMDANDALHLVQEKRWQAAPNHAQVVRLREFASAVAEQPSA
jgi:protein-tyrosine phosphatase